MRRIFVLLWIGSFGANLFCVSAKNDEKNITSSVPSSLFTSLFFIGGETAAPVKATVELDDENFPKFLTLDQKGKVNIAINTTDKVQSVLMSLDSPSVSFCERSPPFAIFRNRVLDDGTVDHVFRKIPHGWRKLTATAYGEANCKGDVLEIREHSFKVLQPDEDPWQPRIVTVEKNPARKVAGMLTVEDAPWCQGGYAYWLPGHKYENDTPNCYRKEKWARPFTALMDNNDDLNDIDGPDVIDRHDCGTLDVNKDGLLDIYCLVGANSGRGLGFNELYLTQTNGSIEKVKTHGLQKHNGMRGRFTTVLNGMNDTKYVFIATKGKPREDEKSNKHRMYRATGVAPDYFEEVEGPYVLHSIASFVLKVDVNDDGLDDFIVGNNRDYALFFVQDSTGGTWSQVWPEHRRYRNWRSARVGDFDNDGIPDLLVVYFGHRGYFRIFHGTSKTKAPFWDIEGNVYTQGFLSQATPDVELLDVNNDGILDFYAVQSEEKPRPEINGIREITYCADTFIHSRWWRKGNQPPPEFVPPPDAAPDVLFVGSPSSTSRKFKRIVMNHAEPGCGNLLRPFGPNKLFLAQGDFVRPGHNLVLEWDF